MYQRIYQYSQFTSYKEAKRFRELIWFYHFFYSISGTLQTVSPSMGALTVKHGYKE